MSGPVHHAPATVRLEEAEGEILAFCRITQMGFLRLLTNERMMAQDVFTRIEPGVCWNDCDGTTV